MDLSAPPVLTPERHLARYGLLYLSLLIHVVVLSLAPSTFVSMDGGVRESARRDQQRVEQSLARTRVAELQRHVERLEEIRREMAPGGGQPGPASNDVAALEQRARQLSDEIHALGRRERSEKLAAMLDISPEQALQRVLAQEQQAKPAPPQLRDIERQLAQATSTLQQLRKDQQRQQEGVGVQQGGTAGPGKRPGVAPPGTMGGPASARGVGQGGNGKGRGMSGTQGEGTGTNGTDGPSDANEDGMGQANRIPLPALVEGGSGSDGPNSYGRIPALPDASIKTLGATIGADGVYGNRLMLDDWYIVGPFAGNKDRRFANNPVYPPEQAVLLDAVYAGKNERLLTWQHLAGARYPITPPVLSEDAVYYAYTEVRLDQDRDLRVWVGADDHVRLWVNDEIAYTGDASSKRWFFSSAHGTMQGQLMNDWNLTEATRVVRFKKGVNRLLLKVSNGPAYVFFSVVLTPK